MSFAKFAKGRLVQANLDGLVWADIASVFTDLSDADKIKILDAVKARKADRIGKGILTRITAVVEAKAQAEYQQMISDQKLTAAEIARLFP